LAKEQYVKRHDSVFSNTLQHVQGNSGEVRQRKWYNHTPKSVKTSHESKKTMLYNQQVQTDTTIPNNEPNIMIRDNEKKNMSVNRCCNFGR
jgi:hypothetical protein